ncbi:MAG TPA: DegV family protein [Clostridiales bacterium]|nr:DegV family protein [Clostridiales bacterium]
MDNQKIVISCDSTCDLSPELLQKYDIKVMPLYVVMNDKTFKDGVDIQPDEIYKYRKETGRLPKTAAANMNDFYNFFKQYTDEGHSVIHINISSDMSITHNNARNAAEQLENVYVVDSKNLSTGSGLLVLKAAELRSEGHGAKEIYDHLNELKQRVDASFIVDTLEYLHLGGRCSAVAMLGANLLKLKPCIEVKNGVMGVGKKYRGNLKNVLLEYTQHRLADANNIETDRIFITHSGIDQEIINAVEGKIRELIDFKEILVTRAGCTISAHCGPNTLGVLFVRKSPVV